MRLATRRAPFFIVEPEVAGTPGAAPREVSFDAWLGDDLVRAFPAVLVTRRLRGALLRVRKASGFTIAPARATASDFFRSHAHARRLPCFWLVDVNGSPGKDDVGLTDAGALVVSRRILDVLVIHRASRAVFAVFAPGRRVCRPE